MGNTPTEFYSLRDVAKYAHVCRQSVYLAINKGALKATKRASRWVVTLKDLEDYQANKYNRDKMKVDGELVYDIKKGQLSVFHVSKILGEVLKRPYPINRIYYLIYAGKLKATKKRCALVIAAEDVDALIRAEQEALARPPPTWRP